MKREKWIPYTLLLPSLFLIITLYGYPILLTTWQSFNEVNLLTSTREFIGFRNYRDIFSDPGFYTTLGITAKYTVITVLLKIFLGFGFAYILSREIFLKKQFRFLILIPWAIPQVAVSTLWAWILNGDYGYLNYYLINSGIISEPLRFLSDPNLAFYCASFVDSWIGISLVSMMFLSGLEAIPRSLYEAAEVDGAGHFRQFIDITIPGIKKLFMTILILVTIWTFNSFNVIYVLTKGGPMRATETLIIKIYQEAFSRFNLGMSSTLTVITVVILSIMTVIYVKGLNSDEG